MELQFDDSFAQNPGGTVTAGTVGEQPFVTAEQFSIRSAEVDQQAVRPGETVTVTVEYGSEFDQIPFKLTIDSDHPDYCDWGGIGFSPGADLFLEVVGGSTNTSDGACWNVANNESIVTPVDVAVPLTEGETEIDVRLKGRATDQTYDSETVSIQVDERAPENPDPPDPDPPEDPKEEGPFAGLIDSLTFGTDSAAVPLVILVVILIALLYLTAI